MLSFDSLSCNQLGDRIEVGVLLFLFSYFWVATFFGPWAVFLFALPRRAQFGTMGCPDRPVLIFGPTGNTIGWLCRPIVGAPRFSCPGNP